MRIASQPARVSLYFELLLFRARSSLLSFSFRFCHEYMHDYAFRHIHTFSRKKFVYQNYIIQEYIATSMHMFSLYFECLYLVSVRHIYIYIWKGSFCTTREIAAELRKKRTENYISSCVLFFVRSLVGSFFLSWHGVPFVSILYVL